MLYELTIPAGRVLFRALFKLKVVGSENIPRHGPGIVCSNHCSYLDPMLAVVAIPRKAYSLSRKEVYRQPLLGPFVRHLGAVCVDRDAPAQKEALATLLRIMDDGNLCVIYPEGTRSPDGYLQKPRNGAAFLAVKSGAPVIPMAVIGAYECWPRQRRIPRVGQHVTVRIGAPAFYRLPANQASNHEELTRISNDIMNRIRALQDQGQA